jgi:hypothetical protein
MRTPTWCRRRANDVGPACTSVIASLLELSALATPEDFDFAASPKLPAAPIRTSPLRSGSTVESQSCSTAQSGSARPTSPKHLGHLAIRQGAEVRFYKTRSRRPTEIIAPAVIILGDFAMRELTRSKPTTSTNSSANAPRLAGR